MERPARRAHRRHPARDRDRPEPAREDVALDRRHDDGAARLPEAALRQGRRRRTAAPAARRSRATRPRAPRRRASTAHPGRARPRRLRRSRCPAGLPWAQAREGLPAAGFVRVLGAGRRRAARGARRAARRATRVTVVQDRLTLRAADRGRLVESLEQAFRHGRGRAAVVLPDAAGEPLRFSTALECAALRLHGARADAEPVLVQQPARRVRDAAAASGASSTSTSTWWCPIRGGRIARHAIKPWSTKATGLGARRAAQVLPAPRASRPTCPWESARPTRSATLVLDGDGRGRYPGVRRWFRWLEGRTYRMHVRVFLARYRSYRLCPACEGARVRPEALDYRVGGRTIADVNRLPDRRGGARSSPSSTLPRRPGRSGRRAHPGRGAQPAALPGRGGARLPDARPPVAHALGRRARARRPDHRGRLVAGEHALRARRAVDRPPPARHRAAGAPAAPPARPGQHGRRRRARSDDHPRRRPRDRPRTRRGRARRRGAVRGPVAPARRGARLGHRRLPVRPPRASRSPRSAAGRSPAWRSASAAPRPTTCATSTSTFRSPASSPSPASRARASRRLVEDVLYRGLRKRLGQPDGVPGPHRAIEGAERIADVILVDQSQIGSTPRANAATYLRAYDGIRACFAGHRHGAAARLHRGDVLVQRRRAAAARRAPARASSASRCSSCPTSTCRAPSASGARFQPEVLEVRWQGRTIREVLDLTVAEALERASPTCREVRERLRPLADVGLDYLRLGQPLSTLSGGEAQRVKLAAHLGREARAHTLFIFDEPTTGLHLADIEKLLGCFARLVERGHSLARHRAQPRGGEVRRLGDRARTRRRRRRRAGRGRGPARARRRVPRLAHRRASSATSSARAADRRRRRRAGVGAGAARRVPGIRVVGAREHNLRDVRARAAARPAHRVHRPVGLGQVVARLRRALRRGPAALPRQPVGLRPPVPPRHGQARRRPAARACRPRSPSSSACRAAVARRPSPP